MTAATAGLLLCLLLFFSHWYAQGGKKSGPPERSACAGLTGNHSLMGSAPWWRVLRGLLDQEQLSSCLSPCWQSGPQLRSTRAVVLLSCNCNGNGSWIDNGRGGGAYRGHGQA